MLWDSHPLALGATPQQVWIDGIAQLDTPHLLHKPASFQKLPNVPKFDKEREAALKYDGLPPLMPNPATARTVIFTNVSSVFLRDSQGVRESFSALSEDRLGVAVVRDGALVCVGTCAQDINEAVDVQLIDLEGGAVSPALTSVGTGTPLGLAEIDQEESTHDGVVPDALSGGLPALAGGSSTLIRAADGLVFGTRDAL